MKPDQDIAQKKSACPCCMSKDWRIFYEIGGIPVNSVMNCLTRGDARSFPRGDLSLGVCRGCGFIWNTCYDPKMVRYSSACEESQGYSETFTSFAKSLAQYLVDKYELHGKKIVEIGCGKGEFLKYICSIGRNRGVGIDPAYVPGRNFESEDDENLVFIQDYYSSEYSIYAGEMICCRMTLEHISNPDELVATVRRSIGSRMDTIVFFQVPDVTRILKTCAFEDIYYEHCSYFSPGSLSRLFQRNGFTIVDLKTAFDDQYILLECRPLEEKGNAMPGWGEDAARMDEFIAHFENYCPVVLRRWEKRLDHYRQEDRRVVLWGGGSKGVAFLHAVATSDSIEFVVDINPFRQQTFMAGTGQEIIAPEVLKDYRPDVVIVMNAIYREEVQRELYRLELDPLVTTLESPETMDG
jgi:hypothetical protein